MKLIELDGDKYEREIFMEFDVVGYYTANSCVAGSQLPDEPITHVVKQAKNNQKKVDPAFYVPIIAPCADVFQIDPEQETQTSKPKIYRSKPEIKQMVEDREECGGNPMSLPQLPKDKDHMVQFLKQAQSTGQIIWVNGNDHGPIYSMLQQVIDNASGDLHLLFGYDHSVPAHIMFFNELVGLGKDQTKLNGITHLALEMFGADEGVVQDGGQELAKGKSNGILAELFRLSLFKGNMQPFIDRFLAIPSQAGKDFILEYVKAVVTFNSPLSIKEQADTLAIAVDPDNNYRVIASDLSINENTALIGLTPESREQFAARESFAVENTEQYLQLGKKEVVAYAWGAQHTEKAGLPKQIKCLSKEGRAYSVALTGGSYDDSSAFDLAVREMSLTDKRWQGSFAIVLDGYREADMVIHLPYDGSMVISSEGVGVIKLR